MNLQEQMIEKDNQLIRAQNIQLKAEIQVLKLELELFKLEHEVSFKHSVEKEKEANRLQSLVDSQQHEIETLHAHGM